MTRVLSRFQVWLLVVLLTAMPVAAAERLVFGSFQNAANAHNWASRVAIIIKTDVVVE